MTTDSEGRKEGEISGGAEDRSPIPKTSDWILHSLNQIHEDTREIRKESADTRETVARIDEKTKRIGPLEKSVTSLQWKFWVAVGIILALSFVARQLMPEINISFPDKEPLHSQNSLEKEP